tara:strand:+ start:114 stop:233 length:120 start_codon:yes stop_codon:yes gene_type:complete
MLTAYSRSGMPAHFSLRVEITNVAASRKSGTEENTDMPA